MDWVKIKNHFILAIEFNLLYLRKYWKIALFDILLGGVFYFIYYYFSGIFVQNVSNIKEYLSILIIGFLLSFGYFQAFGSITRLFEKAKTFTKYYVFSGFSYQMIRILIWDLFIIFFRFLSFFLVFIIFNKAFLKYIISCFAFTLVIISVSYFTAFIFSPLFIYFRSESRQLLYLIEDILRAIVPIYFLLSYFWFYDYTIFNPPIIFIEEFRKLLLYNKINLLILIEALVVSISYFLLGFYLFKISFEFAKKKGLVKLR